MARIDLEIIKKAAYHFYKRDFRLFISFVKGKILNVISKWNTKYIWKHIHQPWELKWHKEKGIPDFRIKDEKFWGAFATRLFDGFLKLDREAYQPNDYLIDVGCGPRPALDYFSRGIKVCIDPLLNEYLKLCKEMKVTWWENISTSYLYSQPAEQLIDNLIDKGKFILCQNVLQHTFNWRKILENISRYAAHDAIICISTQFETRDIGHPANILEKDFIYEIKENFEILDDVRNPPGGQDILLKLRPIEKYHQG